MKHFFQCFLFGGKKGYKEEHEINLEGVSN